VRIVDLWRTGMSAVFFAMMNLFSSALLLIAILLIALQIAMTLIEFYVLVLFGTLLMPFIILEPTKFIAAKIIPAVFGQLIKYAMIITVAMLTLGLWDRVILQAWFVSSEPPGMEAMLGAVMVALMGAFMAIQIPALAQTLLTGTPNLSATAMLRNMAAMTYMGGKAVDAGKSMAAGAKGQQAQGLSGAAGQTARGLVKGAKAAATGGASLAQQAMRSAARGAQTLRNPPGFSNGAGGRPGGGAGGGSGGSGGGAPNKVSDKGSGGGAGGGAPQGGSGGSPQSNFRML